MGSTPIPDGVYVGFTYSSIDGSPFTHNFITIMHGGVAQRTYEYGPDNTIDDLHGGSRNTPQKYESKLEKATYGYSRVEPPAGVTESQFEKRIFDAAEHYEALPDSELPPYDAFSGANCENMASGLLKAAGVTQQAIERIAETHAFGSIDPHFSKPFDLPSFLDSHPVPLPPQTKSIIASDGSHLNVPYLPNLNASNDSRLSASSDAHLRESASGTAANAPFDVTKLNHEQIKNYVELRKEMRGIFAEQLGNHAATVGVERYGLTSHEHQIHPSSGRVVGFADGKLVAQSAGGHKSAYDYGDLLVAARDPVALDTTVREAIKTGQPLALSVQRGEVTLAPTQESERGHAMHHGATPHLSLGR